MAAARSGTASGLVNTARMVGATLGGAVLGAIVAVFAGGSGEMLGAAAAFAFIRRDSLHPVAKR